jgi:MoaA/NifB/PqqE/SkfB family radical SAM enzyme
MVGNKITKRVFEYFLKNETPPPSRIEINPTNNCNLRCFHCELRGKPEYRPEEEVSDKRYLDIIKEGIELNVLTFNITGGGEPLCRLKTTLGIMNEIKKYGAFGCINTNGTLFTKESIKKLVEIGWDEIRFSLDGPDAETHDYLRGVEGAFEKVIENIKIFNYFKAKLKSNKPFLRFTPVIMKPNCDKLSKMVELAYQLKVIEIFFQPLLIPKNRSENKMAEKIKLGKEEFEKFTRELKKAKEFAAKFDIKTNLNSLDDLTMKKGTEKIIKLDSEKQWGKNFLSIPCFYPWISLHIGTDGTAEPCGGGPSGVPIKQENVKNKSIKEIWYSKSFEEFREKLRRGEIPSVCKECCVALALDNREIRDIMLKINNQKLVEVKK